jgi:hypothetical protein
MELSLKCSQLLNSDCDDSTSVSTTVYVLHIYDVKETRTNVLLRLFEPRVVVTQTGVFLRRYIFWM